MPCYDAASLGALVLAGALASACDKTAPPDPTAPAASERGARPLEPWEPVDPAFKGCEGG